MRVTSQIFNTVLHTLETRKISCHSLGFQTIGYVTNFKFTHKSNVMYLSNSISKFSMILNLYFMKGVSY